MARYGIPLVAATLIILAFILAAGCTGSPAATSGGIKKFGSSDEMKQFIKDNMAKAGGAGSYATDGALRGVEESVAAPAPATQGAAKGVISVSGIVASPDHSTTTVQVAGVDEPDFVKNDGRYIYIISGDRLLIVDAYPASQAQVVSETEIGDTVRDIFINGDRLVLFTTGTQGATTSEVSGGSGTVNSGTGAIAVMPRYYPASSVTTATVYDISDRKNPSVLRDIAVDGDYQDARMIGGEVYLLTREYLYSYDTIVAPAIRQGGKVVATPDVYYFDNPESGYAFSTVTSFDTATGTEKDAKTFLLGSGNIIYVSPDAMYISYQRWHPVSPTYRSGPIIAVPAGTALDNSGSSSSAGITFEEFNKLPEAEKQAVIADLKSGEDAALRQQEVPQTTTVINKIAISDGNIAYVAQGEVTGYLKNQFSMDEYNDNLRVATTSDVWTRSGQYEYNNVFVLDPGMKTIGALTHIAEQENIYATRFINDRLYMVTYKRIDPFFVIDLSDPAKPAILGKLKIPGYSDYLYPYDKNTIIGVGKETATNDWGGVSTRGVKLALFDVSDVANPRQISKVEIGEAGSDSAALYDHKAFLFDKAKNLLVLPVRQVETNSSATVPGTYGTGQQVWYGAYVFGVTPETGFVLKGTVQHALTTGDYYWYGSSSHEVKRSLYIGNDLYTISTSEIIASDLNDVNTTIKTIPLSTGPDYPVIPVKMA